MSIKKLTIPEIYLIKTTGSAKMSRFSHGLFPRTGLMNVGRVKNKIGNLISDYPLFRIFSICIFIFMNQKSWFVWRKWNKWWFFVCLLFSFRPLFPLQCAINCCISADCALQKYKPPTFILVSTENCGRLLSK